MSREQDDDPASETTKVRHTKGVGDHQNRPGVPMGLKQLFIMTKKCVTCSHPDRLAIDRRIIQGGSLPKIAQEFGVSYDSIYHHSKNHVARQLVDAARKKDLMHSMDVISDVEELITRTKNILDDVEEERQFGTALAAIKELRGCYELLSKIAFALHAARLAELEAEQMGQERDEQMERVHIQKRMAKLSDEQLRTMADISFDVFRENWEEAGLPAPKLSKKFVAPKPTMRRTKQAGPETDPDNYPEDNGQGSRKVRILRRGQ